MNDLKKLVDVLMYGFTRTFYVFGYPLNFLTILIGFGLLSLVVYGLKKLFF